MSTSMFRTSALLAIVVITGTNACGGSDSGGSGAAPSSVDSGVDKAKPASSLTQADADKICKAQEAYLASHISEADSVQFACVLLGMFPADGMTVPTVAACEASVKTCKDNFKSMGPTSSTTTCSLQASALTNCTATVQEIEACMTASADATSAAISKVTCDLVTLPADQAQKQISGEMPQACTAVQSKCPGLQVDTSNPATN